MVHFPCFNACEFSVIRIRLIAACLCCRSDSASGAAVRRIFEALEGYGYDASADLDLASELQ